MFNMLIVLLSIARIISASNSQEANISARYGRAIAISSESFPVHASANTPNALEPTITSYSSAPQPIEDTAATLGPTTLKHTGCKCNKKTFPEVKIGAYTLKHIGDSDSAVSKADIVPTTAPDTTAPVDRSSVVYAATPVTTQSYQTTPGPDVPATKAIVSPTVATYSDTSGDVKNFPNPTVLSANNANTLYYVTPNVDKNLANPTTFAANNANNNLYYDTPNVDKNLRNPATFAVNNANNLYYVTPNVGNNVPNPTTFAANNAYNLPPNVINSVVNPTTFRANNGGNLYSVVPTHGKNFANPTEFVVNNAGNVYSVTPSQLKNFPNPTTIAPNNAANSYQSSTTPTPTNYPQSGIDPNYYSYTSPYLANSIDPRLLYSPILRRTGYSPNPTIAGNAFAQGVTDLGAPNQRFIVYNAAPVAQSNYPTRASSPLAPNVVTTVSSTPKPFVYNAGSQNIASQPGVPNSIYGNPAPGHFAGVYANPGIIYPGASYSSVPNQFAYSGSARSGLNNLIPVNGAQGYSFPPVPSAFPAPDSYAQTPKPLPANYIPVPVIANYGSPPSAYSAYPAPIKPNTFSSAPEVSHVSYNGLGVSYSWK